MTNHKRGTIRTRQEAVVIYGNHRPRAYIHGVRLPMRFVQLYARAMTRLFA